MQSNHDKASFLTGRTVSQSAGRILAKRSVLDKALTLLLIPLGGAVASVEKVEGLEVRMRN